MPRTKVSPNTWTWRVGALKCQYKERVPSTRSWRCKLYKEPCRCTRKACAKIGEEKKVIAAGKQSDDSESLDQLLGAQANAQIQTWRDGTFITKDTMKLTLDALTNTLAVLDTPLARRKYEGNHWIKGTVESVHAAWKALTGRDYSVLGEEQRRGDEEPK